jgi:hypothetical protein
MGIRTESCFLQLARHPIRLYPSLTLLYRYDLFKFECSALILALNIYFLVHTHASHVDLIIYDRKSPGDQMMKIKVGRISTEFRGIVNTPKSCLEPFPHEDGPFALASLFVHSAARIGSARLRLRELYHLGDHIRNDVVLTCSAAASCIYDPLLCMSSPHHKRLPITVSI